MTNDVEREAWNAKARVELKSFLKTQSPPAKQALPTRLAQRREIETRWSHGYAIEGRRKVTG